jgi:GGDEF domain-containing protein
MTKREPKPSNNEADPKKVGLLRRLVGRHSIGVDLDETRLLRAELEEARRAIRYDEKTGLLTDFGLEEARQELLEKSEGKGRFMLVQIDLDNFGQINKKYGQAKGDMAIKIVADILSNAFRRDGELISRSNKQGDEFRLILPLMDDSKYEGGEKRESSETNSQYLTRILRTELQRLIEFDKDQYDFMRDIDFSVGDKTYDMPFITQGIDELSKLPDAYMQNEKEKHRADRRDNMYGPYSI